MSQHLADQLAQPTFASITQVSHKAPYQSSVDQPFHAESQLSSAQPIQPTQQTTAVYEMTHLCGAFPNAFKLI